MSEGDDSPFFKRFASAIPRIHGNGCVSRATREHQLAGRAGVRGISSPAAESKRSSSRSSSSHRPHKEALFRDRRAIPRLDTLDSADLSWRTSATYIDAQ